MIDQIQLLLRINASAFMTPISYKWFSRVFVSLLQWHNGVPSAFQRVLTLKVPGDIVNFTIENAISTFDYATISNKNFLNT